jgi:isopropylmalate/homocitrate/citramalate synthase
VYRSYNELPKIRLPEGREVADIHISDSTIREGAQMPGLTMRKEHKVTIYEYLHRLGIEKTESFLLNQKDRKAVKEMLDLGYDKPEVTGWARANTKDIDLIIDADGIEETGILMSVSDAHIFDKLELKSREEAAEKYIDAFEYALDHGLKVRCHLEDITRSDVEGFVLPLVSEMVARAPDTIMRICDTINYGIPFLYDLPYSVPRIITVLKESGVRNIETHIHDDFGFGVAASIAGFWYGANWSNLTFLGMGERAGVGELEKVIVFLEQRVENFHKYNLDCLAEFADYIEQNIGLRVPDNKAVVGRNVFAHESGIHTAGVIKNPFVYEPYPPELVGAKRKLMIGATSGSEVIRHKIEELLREKRRVQGDEIMSPKLDKKAPQFKAIQADIRRKYENERTSCISDEELRDYIEQYFLETA